MGSPVPKGICRKLWVHQGTVVMCSRDQFHKGDHQFGLLVQPIAEGWEVIGVLADTDPGEEDTSDPATWNWDDVES